jgi:NitT/TauT family transport system permease protein
MTSEAIVTESIPVSRTVPSRKTRGPVLRTFRIGFWGPPLAVLAIILLVWYIVSYTMLQPRLQYLLPPPDQILSQSIGTPATFNKIAEALALTALVALIGLLIAIVIGITWAVVMSQAKWAERSLFPYAVLLQCIPILAIVPLIGFWFGFDWPARLIVCVLIALFPIVSNTLFGLQSVDRAHHELFRLQGANRWTILTKLQFPAALPAIFAGMRISAGLSVVGAIVADFFFRRGTPGLGIVISNYQSRLQGPELFASILTAALFGVTVFLIFGWLGRLAVGKWYDAS